MHGRDFFRGVNAPRRRRPNKFQRDVLQLMLQVAHEYEKLSRRLDRLEGIDAIRVEQIKALEEQKWGA